MKDELTIESTTLRLIQGDLTEVAVDAIVNAANSRLLGGGGVDGAIHLKGGRVILDACKALRRDRYPEGLPTGQAVLTTAGALPARYVIHTVGPIWWSGDQGEPALLADAYRNALEVARAHGLRTVAFPSISTGAYRFPIGQAAHIALATTASHIRRHPHAFDVIRFVLFSQPDFQTYQQALSDLSQSISTGDT